MISIGFSTSCTFSFNLSSEGVVENATISPVAWNSPSEPFKSHLNSSAPARVSDSVFAALLKKPVSLSLRNEYAGAVVVPSRRVN